MAEGDLDRARELGVQLAEVKLRIEGLQAENDVLAEVKVDRLSTLAEQVRRCGILTINAECETYMAHRAEVMAAIAKGRADLRRGG
ncbi:MAG: hypothetical protein KUA35_14390 [Pseudodesulfovibrio sp.]|uniref:Uncharacterized protein n=1 Tax=Pseudodesulfovibrio aespoeensis (strain ATCC 700646 / DSM 10631 / Aspo-2) TaxID=643562 RepID=E6VZH1_PSEA9|nr:MULTISPECIES: hypothetical protein [Pseudodesulfovibrio]MBU4191659.1 hypothetical protein [Pseudomonadota bacterium]ADU61685.1 hypothetical protein Daes_0668 [Pseudodesulfovibrio aespoeensis Aspo-2]MBU4244311.1 hypothetical protein [Pseudomonadota bacterium]MBU4379650.1 hypothetical protein [Pseudomonadota bacterium]MBU4517502.1 hypothetical protein [Pseudomonadota bacterium]